MKSYIIQSAILICITFANNCAAQIQAPKLAPSETITVDVQHVTVPFLIATLAKFGGFNIVAGDELKSVRINVKRSTVTPWDLFAELIRQQNLEFKKIDNNLIAVASACRLSAMITQLENLPPAYSPMVEISRATSQVVFRDIYAKLFDITIDMKMVNDTAPLTISTDSTATTKLQFSTALLVQGWKGKAESSKKFNIYPNTSLDQCGAVSDPKSHDIHAWDGMNQIGIPEKCFTLEGKLKKQCGLQDNVDFPKVKPRGHIAAEKAGTRWAILELPKAMFVAVTEGSTYSDSVEIRTITDTHVLVEGKIQKEGKLISKQLIVPYRNTH